jgi:hypothetical protein
MFLLTWVIAKIFTLRNYIFYKRCNKETLSSADAGFLNCWRVKTANKPSSSSEFLAAFVGTSPKNLGAKKSAMFCTFLVLFLCGVVMSALKLAVFSGLGKKFIGTAQSSFAAKKLGIKIAYLVKNLP